MRNNFLSLSLPFFSSIFVVRISFNEWDFDDVNETKNEVDHWLVRHDDKGRVGTGA